MKLTHLIVVVGSIFSIVGCSPFTSFLQENSGEKAQSSESLENPYTNQALTIMQTNCSSCHGSTGGSGNVYGLNDISHMVATGLIVPGSATQSLIYNEIVTNSMPPGTPLSADEKHVILNWLSNAGSAGTPSPTPAPSPTPSPTPTPKPTPTPTPSPTPTNPNATYTYISKNILQVRCTSCHSSMKTYTGTMKYVSAGKPNSSSLFTEVNSGAMPRGSSKLSSASIQAIKDWILSGAKNN